MALRCHGCYRTLTVYQVLETEARTGDTWVVSRCESCDAGIDVEPYVHKAHWYLRWRTDHPTEESSGEEYTDET